MNRLGYIRDQMEAARAANDSMRFAIWELELIEELHRVADLILICA